MHRWVDGEHDDKGHQSYHENHNRPHFAVRHLKRPVSRSSEGRHVQTGSKERGWCIQLAADVAFDY